MTLRARVHDYFHNAYQPGERKLLQKIDFFILTFCCLSYFVNYVSLHEENFLDRLLIGHELAGSKQSFQRLRYWYERGAGLRGQPAERHQYLFYSRVRLRKC